VKLVIASRNPGKLREIQAILGDLPIELVAAVDFPKVDETGATFAENAELKARSAARHSGCWALADDSGLEVEALGGAPGVRSARFGSPSGTTDTGRIALLLEQLRAVPVDRRAARFRAAVAIAAPDGRVWIREGACEGVIAETPRGAGGFGYDPVFYLPSYGKTMAELDLGTKNRISHRARALAGARQVLEVAVSDP
jgi:XTP/dITP diphosphohydrolase